MAVRLGGGTAPGAPAQRAQGLPTALAGLSPARHFLEVRRRSPLPSPCPPPGEAPAPPPSPSPRSPPGTTLHSRWLTRLRFHFYPQPRVSLSVDGLLALTAGGSGSPPPAPRSPQPSRRKPCRAFSPETVHVSAHFFTLLSHLSGVSLHCCPASSPLACFYSRNAVIHPSVGIVTQVFLC